MSFRQPDDPESNSSLSIASIVSFPPKSWSANIVVPTHEIWTCHLMHPDWVLILAQNSPDYFSPGEWEKSGSGLQTQAHLSDISRYRCGEKSEALLLCGNHRGFTSRCNGIFHFRLVYPTLWFYNEWLQTSDPTKSSGALVTGFKGFLK